MQPPLLVILIISHDKPPTLWCITLNSGIAYEKAINIFSKSEKLKIAVVFDVWIVSVVIALKEEHDCQVLRLLDSFTRL